MLLVGLTLPVVGAGEVEVAVEVKGAVKVDDVAYFLTDVAISLSTVANYWPKPVFKHSFLPPARGLKTCIPPYLK